MTCAVGIVRVVCAVHLWQSYRPCILHLLSSMGTVFVDYLDHDHGHEEMKKIATTGVTKTTILQILTTSNTRSNKNSTTMCRYNSSR